MRNGSMLVIGLSLALLAGCGGDDEGGGGTGGNAGASGDGASGEGGTSGEGASGEGGTSGEGASGDGGMSGDGASGDGGTGGGSAALPSFEEATMLIEAYAAAHPGMDGDVVAKSEEEIAADPEAQAILALCGEDERPVIPQLAWEYGGSDHAWIGWEQAALLYCVYIPVSPSSDHWAYDASEDHVTADVYLPFPDDNPCSAETGAAQIAACIGDDTNFEIMVDTASLHDGAEAGLQLSEATTDLMLVLDDGSKVMLWHDE